MLVKDLVTKYKLIFLNFQLQQGNKPNVSVDVTDGRRSGNFDYQKTMTSIPDYINRGMDIDCREIDDIPEKWYIVITGTAVKTMIPHFFDGNNINIALSSGKSYLLTYDKENGYRVFDDSSRKIDRCVFGEQITLSEFIIVAGRIRLRNDGTVIVLDKNKLELYSAEIDMDKFNNTSDVAFDKIAHMPEILEEMVLFSRNTFSVKVRGSLLPDKLKEFGVSSNKIIDELVRRFAKSVKMNKKLFINVSGLDLETSVSLKNTFTLLDKNEPFIIRTKIPDDNPAKKTIYQEAVEEANRLRRAREPQAIQAAGGDIIDWLREPQEVNVEELNEEVVDEDGERQGDAFDEHPF